MKKRFEGADGKPRLERALESQKICVGDSSLGTILSELVEIQEIEKGGVIIKEGAFDDDVFFIIGGSFSISVKENIIAQRSVNDCVGEMSAIDPSSARSATVSAKETSVVAKISEADFIKVADTHPVMWRNIAMELSKRLIQRNSLIVQPNDKPRLFIISSKEALAIADDIQLNLQHSATVKVWTDGVFFASSYTLEALEMEVEETDFAIAIAQPDDMATSRGITSKIARDNVIFELGLFMGKLGRDRTILFQPEGQELVLPTDLKGLTAISYKVGPAKDMPALLGGPCTEVRRLIKDLGVKK